MNKQGAGSTRFLSEDTSDESSPCSVESEILIRNRKLLAYKKSQPSTRINVAGTGPSAFRSRSEEQFANSQGGRSQYDIANGSTVRVPNEFIQPLSEPEIHEENQRQRIIDVTSFAKVSNRSIGTSSVNPMIVQDSCPSINNSSPDILTAPLEKVLSNISLDGDSHQWSSSNSSKEHDSMRRIRRKRKSRVMKTLDNDEVGLLIPRLSFQRLVRSIMQTHYGFGIQSTAIAALHEASESMLVDFFEDAKKYAEHRDKATVGLKDVNLAIDVRHKYDKSFA